MSNEKPAQPSMEPASEDTTPAPPPKQRILVAEDSPSGRKQLQQLLESQLGVVVETVANGSEALEALSERPYSIVITDLKMPHLDGMQLIEEVQKRRLPVAVI